MLRLWHWWLNSRSKADSTGMSTLRQSILHRQNYYSDKYNDEEFEYRTPPARLYVPDSSFMNLKISK
ncbi:hypothetical protein U0070_017810 [Myodes glareolus]|uniref:Uncharacterized protein n=1 Tax=Myodes glareolus TaxID=447135 RepID=A0AAW0K9W1_MYOGA